MTWIYTLISLISAILTIFGAIIVHLRAYDWEKRLEKVENRTLSNRTKLYNELGKTRDEVLQEVQSFLHMQQEAGHSSSGDIGNAILMQMLTQGGMQAQTTQAQQDDNFDAIHEILLGNGGDTSNGRPEGGDD